MIIKPQIHCRVPGNVILCLANCLFGKLVDEILYIGEFDIPGTGLIIVYSTLLKINL